MIKMVCGGYVVYSRMWSVLNIIQVQVVVDTNVLPICPEGQITELFTCLINTFILTYWHSQKANGLILVKMSVSNSKINAFMVGSDRYSIDDSARDAGGENKVSDSECHVLFSNEDSNAVLNVLNPLRWLHVC